MSEKSKKERPILFNRSMVRAILEGRKTQTRRVLKPRPAEVHQCADRDSFPVHAEFKDGHGIIHYTMGEQCAFLCPYGQIGDRLWVRETWGEDRSGSVWQAMGRRDAADWQVYYRATDGWNGPWFPSIHMPRKASRISLVITGVRVERLNEISEEDAIAEGAARNDAPGEEWDGTYLTPGYMAGLEGSQDDEPCYSARQWFRSLWGSINGRASWAENPWCWAVEFKRVGRPT